MKIFSFSHTFSVVITIYLLYIQSLSVDKLNEIEFGAAEARRMDGWKKKKKENLFRENFPFDNETSSYVSKFDS
jgi:hypothetical protein